MHPPPLPFPIVVFQCIFFIGCPPPHNDPVEDSQGPPPDPSARLWWEDTMAFNTRCGILNNYVWTKYHSTILKNSHIKNYVKIQIKKNYVMVSGGRHSWSRKSILPFRSWTTLSWINTVCRGCLSWDGVKPMLLSQYNWLYAVEGSCLNQSKEIHSKSAQLHVGVCSVS